MKYNKNVVVLIVIIALLYVGYGCKNSAKQNINVDKTIQNGKQTTNKSKDALVKLANPNIKVLTWDVGVQGNFEDAVTIFEKIHGGKVDIDVVLASETREKLIATMSAGDPYDMTYWTQKEMPIFAIIGILQPIDAYFNFMDPLWADSIGIMNQLKYKGKIYGISDGPEPIFIYYNNPESVNILS